MELQRRRHKPATESRKRALEVLYLSNTYLQCEASQPPGPAPPCN